MARKLNPSIFHTTKHDQLIFGHGNDGKIYLLEEGNDDDGDPIESRWTSGWLDMRRPDLWKRFVEFNAKLVAFSSPITLTWETDHGRRTGSFPITVAATVGVWGAPGSWGAPPNFPGLWGGVHLERRALNVALPQECQGHALRITLSSEDRADPWKMTSWMVKYKPLQQTQKEGNI